MAKKRQQDFHKTQLKPGRTISKRRNITNTSIKAKKITIRTPRQRARSLQTKTIPECLVRIKESSSVNAKKSALEDLSKLVSSNPDSLPPHLSRVLNAVLKLVLELDESVRSISTMVIVNVLTYTSDLQIQSFVPLFNNVLSCAMTHSNIKIKEHSLNLVKHMVQLHPKLFCTSVGILNDLLQMLIGLSRTRTRGEPQGLVTKHKNIPVIYNDNIYSPSYRVHILDHINLFLSEMLKTKSDTINSDRDEHKVYWDSEDPLYVQVYAHTGLKPFDVSKCYSSSIYLEERGDESEEIVAFLDNMIHTLPVIFAEEISSESRTDGVMFHSNMIKNFNIIFEVLVSITEWLKFIPSECIEKSIRKFLKDFVLQKGLFPFKQRGIIHIKEEKSSTCVQLNLRLCLLFCTHLMDHLKNPHNVHAKDAIHGKVIDYMKIVFQQSPEIICSSIPLIIEIMKIYFKEPKHPEISDFLCDCISQLSNQLKYFDNRRTREFHVDPNNRDILISLLTDLSLDAAYQFILVKNCLKVWFNWLLNYLSKISITDDVDKKLLSTIKKIANQRYPSFQVMLMHYDFSFFKGLLQDDDNDVRDVALFLIYHMKDIDTDLLANIACFISSNPTFPKNFTLRLVRLLFSRYSEKPENGEIPEVSIYNGRGLIDLVQFLLNVAIDSYNINNKKFINFEDNHYTRSVELVKDFAYTVVPSTYWNEHSQLFDVCFKFLNQLPSNIVSKVAMSLFQEILDNTRILPIHTVIAIFKLSTPAMQDKSFLQLLSDLTFNSLLTVSILTHMLPEEEWFMASAKMLLDSMKLERQIALDSLQQIEDIKDGDLSALAAYHVLRVFKFYLRSDVLDSDDFQTLSTRLEFLKDKCADQTIEQQPLFRSLYSHLSYFI